MGTLLLLVGSNAASRDQAFDSTVINSSGSSLQTTNGKVTYIKPIETKRQNQVFLSNSD